MDLIRPIYELIDLRSFSNLWFWLALGAIWFFQGSRVLGVPWDMIVRARQGDAAAGADLEQLAQIHGRRVLRFWRGIGPVATGGICCALTMLGLLGFAYGHEFSQALVLLGVPLGAVGLMSGATARRIEQGGLRQQALWSALIRLRNRVQIVSMVAIAVTTFWGMARNAALSVIW